MELWLGMAVGRRWEEAGQPEAAAVVFTSFGRRLGTLLRELGRLDESEAVLEEALAHARDQDLVRARLLGELATTLAHLGALDEADAGRLAALRIMAGELPEPELTLVLRRLAELLERARSVRPTAESSVPPPRRSTWRVKPGLDVPPAEAEPQPARRGQLRS
jgi:hypothetical protein